MSENITSYPCYIQLKQPVQSIELNPNLAPVEIIKQEDEEQQTNETSCIFQIVYPQEFSLIPVNSMKRGRPRKKIVDDQKKPADPQKTAQNHENVLKKAPRTRSGRLVKLPKHMEADFKKIDTTTDELDLQLSDFKRYEEKENTKKIDFIELKQKKRNISSQYRCPKCFKAYLGKSRMIEHIKKYPDHALINSNNNNDCKKDHNFDVWNYLYDITQKSKSGQKGVKFCNELTNLLHNLQLLKTTLFKPVIDNSDRNNVIVDKVLGDAIGLTPGKYKFNENELYKDVTVLRLINSDFFKPNNNSKDGVEICSKKFKQNDDDKDDNTTLLNDDLTILTTVDNSNDLGDVMNVDQFVNERFKKIVEPDIDLNNSNQSLNLDLPSLELFQFHTS